MPIEHVVLWTALMTTLGGVMYRLRGSDLRTPRWLKRGVYALALALAALPAMGVWATILIPLAWLGIVMRHGVYFPNETEVNQDTGVMRWLTTKIARTEEITVWRKMIGMALTGLVITLPVGVAAVFFSTNPIIALYLPVGVLKAVAYFSTSNTERAEVAWGGVSVGSLALLAVL
jgi:hypothetical protein